LAIMPVKMSAKLLGLISQTFIRTAFMSADPRSAKRQSSYQCNFSLLGSGHVKTARKTLAKFTQIALNTVR